jgi:hypothetical protein
MGFKFILAPHTGEKAPAILYLLRFDDKSAL